MTSEDEMNESNESSMQTPPKKRKVEKRLQKYKLEWEDKFEWISKDPNDDFNAKCKTCNITISIGKSGIGQVST